VGEPDSGKLLRDPYLEWVGKEGIPIVEDFGIDLFEVETKPWPRLGVAGAAIHPKGRGDFVNMFLLDLPSAGATSPQRHLYEEVFYVLDGRGSTTIATVDGRKHSFEWGPMSMFAIPLNAQYRLFNGSGSERARLVCTTSLPVVLNLFHHEAFVFGNDWRFDERMGEERYFSGEGDLIPANHGQHLWETNFVPDLSAIELKDYGRRGADGKNLKFVLADGVMHAHLSEMAAGTYKKAHRHGPGICVTCITGQGYSLLWYEGESDLRRVDWRHGTVFAPPSQMFHQHFATSPEPARYLATGLGGLRYPFWEEQRVALSGGSSTSLKQGGNQIEYQDQPPHVHEMFEQEMQKAGVEVRMKKFIGKTAT
jgi:mannose-6-phosphate isomerase-like protein (cupin superfamily)